MASALTNCWAISRSSQRGSKNNSSDGSFMVPARNHNRINRKHLLLREKDASTGWQITKAWCTSFPLVVELARPYTLFA